MVTAYIAGTSCSRRNDAKSPTTATDSATIADYYKLYDPTSLKEVTDFQSLPPGIRSHYGRPGVGFSVGGLSSTSAFAGSQRGDFVPYYVADAYVFVNNQWVRVKTWEGLAIADQAKKLSDWVDAIRFAEEYSTSKGLDVTLSCLNLADPIIDLDKNIALDKSYFIGLCEPPGHTPGVAAADEPLVHTPAHGLWCLPGSGDAVTSDDYAKLIDQARAYASTYNAELLRRIKKTVRSNEAPRSRQLRQAVVGRLETSTVEARLALSLTIPRRFLGY